MATPVRTCIGCRQRAPQSELVRWVWDDVTGGPVTDERRRSPGRGAWLHPGEACRALADKRKAWTRALRRPVPVHPDQSSGGA